MNADCYSFLQSLAAGREPVKSAEARLGGYRVAYLLRGGYMERYHKVFIITDKGIETAMRPRNYDKFLELVETYNEVPRSLLRKKTDNPDQIRDYALEHGFSIRLCHNTWSLIPEASA